MPTKQEIIAIVQAGLDDGTLTTARIDDEELRKTPPPAIPVPTLTNDPFIVAGGDRKGRVEMHWSKVPGATYHITRDNVEDGVSNDETHYAVGPKPGGSYYGVAAVINGQKSAYATKFVPLGSTPAEEPPVVTDPAIPDNAIKIDSLDDFNSKHLAGKNYVLRGHLKFSDESGLRVVQNGVGIYCEPGTLIEFTGEKEYPRCIDVLADDVTIAGFTFKGPEKTIGIQLNAVSNPRIIAVVANGLGTMIECKGAENLLWENSDVGDLRRYGIYGKLTGKAVFRKVKLGSSTGDATGDDFDQEHGFRIEQGDDILFEECSSDEGKAGGDKSGLQVKVVRGKLRVVGGTFYNAGLGPLGDKQGLQHKSDPRFVLRGAELIGVKFLRELRLELNFIDGIFRSCDIAKLVGDDSGQYASQYLAAGRKLPSARFESCRVGTKSGRLEGFTFA